MSDSSTLGLLKVCCYAPMSRVMSPERSSERPIRSAIRRTSPLSSSVPVFQVLADARGQVAVVLDQQYLHRREASLYHARCRGLRGRAPRVCRHRFAPNGAGRRPVFGFAAGPPSRVAPVPSLPM
jgi:hypothetical protein